MLKMSFFDGTLNKKAAIAYLKKTDKPYFYTVGFKSKRPLIYDNLITLKKAIEIIEKESLLDIAEYQDRIELNAFTWNDLF